MDQINDILAAETHPEVVLSIFGRNPYPVSGQLDESLLERALKQVASQRYFSIRSLRDDPLGVLEEIGHGEGQAEFQEEFLRLQGQRVYIGDDPFNAADTDYFKRPDDVFVLGYYIYPKPHTTRNHPLSGATQ